MRNGSLSYKLKWRNISHPHPLRGHRHVTGLAITSLCRLQVERWWDSGGNRGSTFPCTAVATSDPKHHVEVLQAETSWVQGQTSGRDTKENAHTVWNKSHFNFSFSVVWLVYIEEVQSQKCLVWTHSLYGVQHMHSTVCDTLSLLCVTHSLYCVWT